MNRPLPFVRVKRPALAAASIVCFTAAIALMPAGVRSQLDAASPRALAPLPSPATLPATVEPAGDAFAPRALVDDQPPPVRLPAALPVLRAPRPAAVAERRAAPPRVTAVATGAEPSAVVDIDGVPRIVNPGDALDGSTVAAIDDDAVLLADGRRLPLEPAGAAP